MILSEKFKKIKSKFVSVCLVLSNNETLIKDECAYNDNIIFDIVHYFHVEKHIAIRKT